MHNKQYIKVLGPSVAWALFISLGSLLPSSGLPSQNIPDKLIHGIIYFVLALLLAFGFAKQVRWPRLRYNSAYFGFAIALVYGLLLELIQLLFISTRAGEWLDLLSNIIGAFLAIPVFKIVVGNVFDKK